MTSISVPSPRSAARQVRSSRPSPPSVPSFQPPNGLSAPSLATQTIKGYPCVYTREYQEYYVKGMERLEKGKGKEWSVKKREFKVMKEWEKEWKKRNGKENGGVQESISQDGDPSFIGAAFSKSNAREKSLNLPSQQDPLTSLLSEPPSSSDSSSSSDLDFVPDALDPHPDHLPSSITHAIHSEVRKIYESPKKKAPSFFLDTLQDSAEVEIEIEEGGQKHLHWLEKEGEGGEEEEEKQRNLEDEMDEEENDDCVLKEDRQEKMGIPLERIGGKHEGEMGEREGEGEMGIGEMGEKIEEVNETLKVKESITSIRGVVEMEEDEEEEEAQEREAIEEQARQTLANPELLQQLKDNYRCDCYHDEEDQEMMKGANDQYGMDVEGGLNSNSEEEQGIDDSNSFFRSLPLPDHQSPSLETSKEQHSTISEEVKLNKLKNSKKKEQKKRKKEERKRTKLAEEPEKVKGEKRKAAEEIVSTTEGGTSEKKKRKRRKDEKGKGSNA